RDAAGTERGRRIPARSRSRRRLRRSTGEQPLGMLAHEPHDRAPVPERAACPEGLVGDRVPAMAYDRLRDVPALPTRRCGAVAEVDLLAVHPEDRVVAAELVEHGPAQEQRAAEHPVGLDRLLRPLVELVVPTLALERRGGPGGGGAG